MKIAVIGIGLMGHAIAQRLLESRFNIVVYNRTKNKIKELKKIGALEFSKVSEAINYADVVLLVLADITAIKEVLFKTSITFKNKTIIQMGTIAPQESIRLAQTIHKLGGEYYECPVLGSKSEAVAGKLILMVGSKPGQYKRYQFLFKSIGQDVLYVGAVGKAAALKLALNNIIPMLAVGYSLSLGILKKNKISVDMFAQILRQSALYAPMFDKKLPNWTSGNYRKANFSTKHMLKDVRLILSEAKSNKIDVRALEGVEKILGQTVRAGYQDLDYSAVFKIINKGL